MTPEETFLRIEDVLRHATEIPARRSEQLGDHDAQIREIFRLHNSLMMAADKAEAQRIEKLGALIDTMDRIVRSTTANKKQ